MGRVRRVLGLALAVMVILVCAILLAGAALVFVLGLFTQQWDAIGLGLFAVAVVSTLIYFAYRSV
jgi:hypothetical protein